MFDQQQTLVADLVHDVREAQRREASKRRAVIQGESVIKGLGRSTSLIYKFFQNDLLVAVAVLDRFIGAWQQEIAEGRPPAIPEAWDAIGQDLHELVDLEVEYAKNHQLHQIELTGLGQATRAQLGQWADGERGTLRNAYDRKLRTLRTQAGLASGSAAGRLQAVSEPGEGEGDDVVTVVFRRSAFDKDLPQALDLAHAASEPLSLLWLDVDEFKRINDEFSHPAGDQALRAVGSSMRKAVDGKGRCYRTGGDEFGAILRNSSTEEARIVAERIRAAVEETRLPDQPRIRVTVSIGIATCPAGGDSEVKELRKVADEAAYRSKGAGRNRVTAETISAVAETA